MCSSDLVHLAHRLDGHLVRIARTDADDQKLPHAPSLAGEVHQPFTCKTESKSTREPGRKSVPLVNATGSSTP